MRSVLAVFLVVFAVISAANAYASFSHSPWHKFQRLGALSSTANNNQPKSLTTLDIMSLSSIRSSLIRQEDSIIFALIERSQYLTNKRIYDPKGLGFNSSQHSADFLGGETESFLEYMLRGTERLHASVRRYSSPEEHRFYPDAENKASVLPKLIYPELLSGREEADNVNFNVVLLDEYVKRIVGGSITDGGDDEQYGSSVLADINALQALSRRIHYGKFVAESKFRNDEVTYRRLVGEGDVDGVMKLLTNKAVEERVLARAAKKAATYGRDPGEDSDCEGKVKPEEIARVYEELVIPLTKKVEVAYLFLRCGKPCPPGYEGTI